MTTEERRQYQLRGTTAQWAANSAFVPAAGEICVDYEAAIMKVGDGVSDWATLPAIGGAGISFASVAEVQAGLVSNKAVAPDVIASEILRLNLAGTPQNVAGEVIFADTVKGVTPTGGSHLTRKDYVDGKHTTSASSTGASAAGKSPILDTNGKLSRFVIPSVVFDYAILGGRTTGFDFLWFDFSTIDFNGGGDSSLPSAGDGLCVKWGTVAVAASGDTEIDHSIPNGFGAVDFTEAPKLLTSIVSGVARNVVVVSNGAGSAQINTTDNADVQQSSTVHWVAIGPHGYPDR